MVTVSQKVVEVRHSESTLAPKLAEFAKARYGDSVVKAAWLTFSQYCQSPLLINEKHTAFLIWHWYAWLPDDSHLAIDDFNSEPSDNPIAIDFLQENKKELTSLEQHFITSTAASPFSFYRVSNIAANGTLQLLDLYQETTVSIQNDQGTERLQIGNVVFGSVISINGIFVLTVYLPDILGNAACSKIEAHREKWKKEIGGRITRRVIYMHDHELRRLYYLLIEQLELSASTLH